MAITPLLLWSTRATAAFPDVLPTHPYARAIEEVQARGFVRGYPDGNFYAERTINRAEFTKIVIASHFGVAEIFRCLGRTRFRMPDVLPHDWFAKYVCVARDHGIIEGYHDGTFRPESLITFAEAAKIVVGVFNLEMDPGHLQGEWWLPYIAGLRSIGALPSSYSVPWAELTRGEMADIMFHVTGGVGQPRREALEAKSGIVVGSSTIEGTAIERQEIFVAEVSSSSSSLPVEESSEGVYADFDESLLTNGERKILFFHAWWCSFCETNDGRLRAWYDTETFKISVYKLDYDYWKTLRSRFVIEHQNTFLVLDGTGKEIRRMEAPDAGALRKLIEVNAFK